MKHEFWVTNLCKKKKNEVEITMEVNNQKRLKKSEKVLKDHMKKEINVIEDNIRNKNEKKAPKRLIDPKDRDIKQLTMKVNDETKQFKKELNETKEVLVLCWKEYTKLYNENIELKEDTELLKSQKQLGQMYLK